MKRNKVFSVIQLLLSLVGAAIAGIVYYAAKASINLPCSTGGGCELVAASHWSHIEGFPVSLIGFAGYSVLALLSMAKLTAGALPSVHARRGLMEFIAFIGTAYSWYLQYVSHVFIGAICAWCMGSAATMTLIYLTLLIEKAGNRGQAAKA